MQIAIFCHSLRSDWNHGNAHFLRGIVTELWQRGHVVTVYEPADSWSARNLVAEQGEQALEDYKRYYPLLDSVRYTETLDLEDALGGTELVLAHEWNAHALIARLGEWRTRHPEARLLFHDTHHRAVTDPQSMAQYDLRRYDGVLAFGKAVRQVYVEQGWAQTAWTWHEAADPRVFRPLQGLDRAGDLVWIGNWGDEERTAELREFLLEPVKWLGLRARVHGVRYPDEAKQALADAGIEYANWLPNYEAPSVFARYAVTVHVPRRPYATALPGIPTIRMFEALACGIPLVSAPWQDSEGLFTTGADYLRAENGDEMAAHLQRLLAHDSERQALADHGRQTVLARHTCAHRVDELMGICRELGLPVERQQA